jgi:signal transduction histidine kinase
MSPEPVELPAMAAVVVALAERRTRELRSELAEVRASRARIVAATDDARRTAERDLHDGAQQRLLSVALALRMARGKLTGPAAGVDLLDEAAAELATALAELRELARGMYPVLLTDAGLGPALAALAERSPVPAELVAAPDRRFARPVEQTCYFVVAETLSATAAAPDGRVRIAVREGGGVMTVEVSTAGVAPGVRGLADRVAAHGGTLRVSGSGVRAVLPCG